MSEALSANRATLAVLPFENLSGPGGVDYLSRGFAEDLITDLSRFAELSVIAAHSSEDARAGELDVHYVLKGSLRRQGETLRINAQLLEPGSGRVAWAGRFDRDERELLRVQDEIGAQVVSTLQNRIQASLLNAARRKGTHELQAYDFWLQGMDALRAGTLAADEAARSMFDRALAADSDFPRAYLGLSLSYFNEWSCQLWDRWDDNEQKALDHAKRAAELDPNDHYAHLVLGRVLLFRREFDQAQHHIERSLSLNLNDADCLVQAAMALGYLGDAPRALGLYERSLRLNPYHDSWYYAFGMLVHFMLGDFQAALDAGQRAPLTAMVDLPAHLAICLHHLGRSDEVHQHVQLFVEQFREKIVAGREPEAGEALRWVRHVNAYRHAADEARLVDGLQQAGLQDDGLPSPIAPRTDLCAFRKVGSLWQLSYRGQDAHLPHVKGLADIAALLQRQDDEIHCAELMGGEQHGGADDTLDAQALQAFRARAADLRQDLSEAETANDLARAEKLRAELDSLGEQLSRDLGLGGRSRKLGAPSERARSAVTQRVRAAIKRVEASHPELGRHLKNAVRTGSFCSYAPETPVDWRLD